MGRINSSCHKTQFRSPSTCSDSRGKKKKTCVQPLSVIAIRASLCACLVLRHKSSTPLSWNRLYLTEKNWSLSESRPSRGLHTQIHTNHAMLTRISDTFSSHHYSVTFPSQPVPNTQNLPPPEDRPTQVSLCQSSLLNYLHGIADLSVAA